MIIQFNTDNNIKGSASLTEPLSAIISDELERFSEHITRVEVHLTDEDGGKDGFNTKRCVLEARLQGKQPIAVKNQADSNEQAVIGAVDKLTASLDTIFGKMRNH